MNASSTTTGESDPIDAEFEPTESKRVGSLYRTAPGWTGFGILFVLLVLLLLLLSYVIWSSVTEPRRSDTVQASPDSERLAGIEQSLSGLRDQTDQQAVMLRNLDMSISRLDQDLERTQIQIAALEAQTTKLDGRIVESDGANGALTIPQSLIDRIGALERARQSAEASATQLASMGQQIETLRSQIESDRTSPSADRLPQASLALVAIRTEAARGRPFVLGYQQLSTALPDNTVVAGLAQYAQSGVPTQTQLTTQFSQLQQSALEQAMSADNVEPNWVDQVFADNVRVRRTDATPLAEALDRAAASLEDGELEAAIAELDTLPANATDPFDEWIANAQNRIELDQRLDSLQLLLVSLAQ